jgi:hypothetical protein
LNEDFLARFKASFSPSSGMAGKRQQAFQQAELQPTLEKGGSQRVAAELTFSV